MQLVIWSSAELFKDDGVLIEEVGPTRTIEALWTTLVVINPPKEVPMQAWIDQVRRGIQSVGSKVSEQDQQTWQARLDALDLQQPTGGANHSRSFRALHSRRHRIRRGVLNLVGEISRSLFGTAMDSDIRELRTALDVVGRNSQVLMHDRSRMLSIVNQTRKYVQENRFDITDLQRHQEAMDSQILDFSDDITKLSHRVSKLALARSIDQVIAQLTVVHESYSAQAGAFLTQKYELERGWLTESTLSITELTEILATIRAWGYETPSVEWYYENLKIEPLWTEHDKLVFRVVIPAVGRTQYLQYKIHFYPVVVDSEHIRVVKGHSDITVNTATGAVFWPHDCYGSKPRVCTPQKEILSPTCEWGLVTNNSLDHCTIEIFRRFNKDSDIFPLGLGSFIVVAYEEISVTLRCLGKSAVVTTLYGPSQFQVPGDCKLETDQWRVSGTRMGSGMQVRPAKGIAYNRSLGFILPPMVKSHVREALQFRSRVQVPLLDMREWHGEKMDVGYSWGVSGGIPGGTFALGLIIVILIVVWRKCRQVRRSGKAKTSRTDRSNLEHGELSDIELASLAV